MVVNKNIFQGEGFADPHAIVENGRVYIFAGRDGDAKNGDYCRMPKWSIVSSDDLIHWNHEADILPTDTYMGDQENCWAGHVLKKGDTFYWYFSNRNDNIGVMTSKNVTGPFTDALGKPLLEAGFSETKSYDPCIFEEDGIHTLFFGFNHYGCCTLSDDLLSVTSEPTMVEFIYPNGEFVLAGDKPNVFKRGDWYYLVSGADYGMSKNLKGPYVHAGAFIGGGHNDVFEWNGQLHLCYEFHDTNIFFRGVGIVALDFNEDGTVQLPSDNPTVFYKERTWDFATDSAKWFLTNGEDCAHVEGGISYALHSFIGLKCPVFPGIFLEQDYQLQLVIDNPNEERLVKVMVETVCYPHPKRFAQCTDTLLRTHVLELKNGVHTYTLPISIEDKQHLKNITLCAFGPEEKGMLIVKSAKCMPVD